MVQLHQLPGNGQSQPRAPIPSSRTAIPLFKGPKNAIAAVLRNANPRINHAEQNFRSLFAIQPLSPQRNLTLFGEFQGIAHQVMQNLLDAIAIGPQLRQLRFNLCHQR